MATPSAPASPVSGEVLFYKNPEPLNLDSHGKLGLNPSPTPFAFAKAAHAVPLVVGEFGPASLSYPIIFAGADYQPLAVLGIRPNENLFLRDDGTFIPGNYVPAFIRRYPFVLAHGGDDQLIVCIDRGADIVVENGQVPLFENGELSAFSKQCMEYCTNFENDRRNTEQFVKLLRDLNLFETREVTITPQNPDGTPGEVVKISEYFTPSEAKFKELPEATQLDFIRSGALQQMYLHWNSLALWERLINETFLRNPAPVAANS
jgi:hypothetical protein